MDAIDRRLIHLLRENARQPLKTLGAAVGLSRSSVRDRLTRLIAEGTIRRFTIETAPASPSCAVLMIRLKATPDPRVVAAICKRPDVVSCYSLSGSTDLLVEVAGDTVAEVNHIRDEIALLAGIADLETSFVLKQDKALASNAN